LLGRLYGFSDNRICADDGDMASSEGNPHQKNGRMKKAPIPAWLVAAPAMA